MLRHWVLLLCFILFPVLASGQDFFAGPLVGAAFSQVDGDRYAGYHHVGLVMGGFVGRRIAPDWNARLEIQYLRKGSRKYADVEAGDDRDYAIELDYIHFPMVVQYQRKNLSFEAGLSIGSLLSSSEAVNFETIPDNVRIPFKTMEIATLLGINYHITPDFWVSGRMSYSIMPVREPYGGSIAVYDPVWDLRKPGQYNNVIILTLYYKLLGQ